MLARVLSAGALLAGGASAAAFGRAGREVAAAAGAHLSTPAQEADASHATATEQGKSLLQSSSTHPTLRLLQAVWPEACTAATPQLLTNTTGTISLGGAYFGDPNVNPLPRNLFCSWELDPPQGGGTVTLTPQWVELGLAPTCNTANAGLTLLQDDTTSYISLLDVCYLEPVPQPQSYSSSQPVIISMEVNSNGIAYGFELSYSVSGGGGLPSPLPSSTAAATPPPEEVSASASASAAPAVVSASGSVSAAPPDVASASESSSAAPPAVASASSSWSVAPAASASASSTGAGGGEGGSPAATSAPPAQASSSSSETPAAPVVQSASPSATPAAPSPSPALPSPSAAAPSPSPAAASRSPVAPSPTPAAASPSLAPLPSGTVAPVAPTAGPAGAQLAANLVVTGTSYWNFLSAADVTSGAQVDLAAATGAAAYRFTGFVFQAGKAAAGGQPAQPAKLSFQIIPAIVRGAIVEEETALQGETGEGEVQEALPQSASAASLAIGGGAPLTAGEPTVYAIVSAIYQQMAVFGSVLRTGSVTRGMDPTVPFQLSYGSPAVLQMLPSAALVLDLSSSRTAAVSQQLQLKNAGGSPLLITAASLLTAECPAGATAAQCSSVVQLGGAVAAAALPLTLTPGASANVTVSAQAAQVPAAVTEPMFFLLQLEHNAVSGPHAAGVTVLLGGSGGGGSGGAGAGSDPSSWPMTLPFQVGAAAGAGIALLLVLLLSIWCYCKCCCCPACCQRCIPCGKKTAAASGGSSSSSSSSAGKGKAKAKDSAIKGKSSQSRTRSTGGAGDDSESEGAAMADSGAETTDFSDLEIGGGEKSKRKQQQQEKKRRGSSRKARGSAADSEEEEEEEDERTSLRKPSSSSSSSAVAGGSSSSSSSKGLPGGGGLAGWGAASKGQRAAEGVELTAKSGSGSGSGSTVPSASFGRAGAAQQQPQQQAPPQRFGAAAPAPAAPFTAPAVSISSSTSSSFSVAAPFSSSSAASAPSSSSFSPSLSPASSAFVAQLRSKPVLKAAEFEGIWAGLQAVELWGSGLSRVPATGELEQLLARHRLACLASGTISGVSKYYFYAQMAVGAAGGAGGGGEQLLLAELSITHASLRLSAVLKAQSPGAVQPFLLLLRESLVSLT